jgi:hypothetical protein
MIFHQHIANGRNSLCRATIAILLASCPFARAAMTSQSRAVVRIWDTVSPFADEAGISDRADWKLVPDNLFSLESKPAAAASDPGYYGREYSFEADAVVENGHLTAVFRSNTGRVAVYSKADGSKKRFELAPLQLKKGSARIIRCRVLRNTGNDAALEVFFSGATNSSVVFAFDKTEIVEVRPAANVEGVSVFGSVQYGVVPDFIGDDLIFDPGQYPSTNALFIPSESMFLGLLEGEDGMLAMTWPQGRQRAMLTLGSGQAGRRTIKSFDFDNDGKSLYLAVLSAAGIWHEAELKLNYLEKDVDMGWQRPFPAKWTMQMEEAGVRTTFTFRESKDNIWRGVIGHYTYPVWFDAEHAFCRLSKKIPPKGRSVIYCLGGKDTPASITTPADILKQTLGRQACESILDFPGRVLRTHHRRGGEGVRRACTCGCTEAIEAVFKARQEVQRAEYVKGAVNDMVYFVTEHVRRIDEYREFAKSITESLDDTGRSAPALKPYLDGLQAIVSEIPKGYERQRENMKDLAYADELARRTKALTQEKSPANLPACLELGKQWRAMGGAQDDVVARYHSLTRKLCQEAGYGCAEQPEAVKVAEEIRRRCRQCLRNADGYEIWSDY